MSQPVYTSLDPLAIRDGILDIGRGNWRAGGDLGELTTPKWMAVVWVDGHVQRGQVPGMPSVSAVTRYPGELGWEERCRIDLRGAGLADGKPHDVKVNVYAAQFFKGWGDAPEDRWEWGHFRSDDGVTPAILTTRFTLGATPPPPPPAPSPTVTLESATTKAVTALYELVEARRALGDTDAKIRETLYYQVIRALNLPVGDGRRVRVKDAIKQAIA